MAATPELPAPSITPVPVREWGPDEFAAFEPMRPPAGSSYAERKTERKQGGAGTAGVLEYFARHPALARAWNEFNRHLLYFSTLSERDKELVILRIACLRRAEYEWAEHVAAALGIGITAEEIERVGAGADAPGWSDADAMVLRATDELHRDGVVSAATWHDLLTRFDEPQLMDLIFTVGAYDTLALAFNCFGIETDPDVAVHRLPPAP